MSDWNESGDWGSLFNDYDDTESAFDPAKYQEAITSEMLKEDIAKAIASMSGDPFAEGQGSLTGGTGSSDKLPNWIKSAFGAAGGAGLGALLAREANKNVRRFAPRGIGHGSGQLSEYKFTPTVGTDEVGSGGRGYPAEGGSYFTQTPNAQSAGVAPVYGANGVMYPSPEAARAAGETNFTYQAPVGVTPPAGGGIGQRPANSPGLQGNQRLVDQAYRSLFGRSADPTGLAFFGRGLDTGQINQQNLLESIRRGAQGSDIDLLARAPIGGWTYAAGGQTPTGLGYLRSAEDGMADRIPATIDGHQPAKLSGGEFVIPADVVSHLGNGNSDAGAKQLHDFMSRIRKARTGNQAQGKRIDPTKFFPKGRG